jgi:3-oxoacyl-[acyl-carrier-protein] synthase II
MRRVVVTGMGIVSPLGTGLTDSWSNLIAGKNGFGLGAAMRRVGYRGKSCGGGQTGQLSIPITSSSRKNSAKWIALSSLRCGRAQEAVEDSGWKPQDDEGQFCTGVMIGSGIGGLNTIYETSGDR